MHCRAPRRWRQRCSKTVRTRPDNWKYQRAHFISVLHGAYVVYKNYVRSNACQMQAYEHTENVFDGINVSVGELAAKYRATCDADERKIHLNWMRFKISSESVEFTPCKGTERSREDTPTIKTWHPCRAEQSASCSNLEVFPEPELPCRTNLMSLDGSLFAEAFLNNCRALHSIIPNAESHANGTLEHSAHPSRARPGWRHSRVAGCGIFCDAEVMI